MILFLLVILISYFIYTNSHSSADNLEMCKRLLNISNEHCGLGAHFTTANIKKHINEVDWQLKHVISYIFIIL